MISVAPGFNKFNQTEKTVLHALWNYIAVNWPSLEMRPDDVAKLDRAFSSPMTFWTLVLNPYMSAYVDGLKNAAIGVAVNKVNTFITNRLLISLSLQRRDRSNKLLQEVCASPYPI